MDKICLVPSIPVFSHHLSQKFLPADSCPLCCYKVFVFNDSFAVLNVTVLYRQTANYFPLQVS